MHIQYLGTDRGGNIAEKCPRIHEEVALEEPPGKVHLL
jgi:hypothetical protein